MMLSTRTSQFARQGARQIAGSRPAFGVSLIELVCVLAIAALLLSSVVPTLREMLVRQVLLATASSLETDVHLARSAALHSDANVRLSIQHLPEGGSCTVVHTGEAHDCRCTGHGQSRCTGSAQLLRLSEQASSRDGTSILGSERSLLFAPGRGTVTPTATLVLAAADGRQLRKIINIMGRMRTCSNDHLPGLPSCG